MSFIHYLSLGHFDLALVPRTIVRVQRPLDADVLTELLARHADEGRVRAPTFMGTAAKVSDGYVVGTLFSPWPIEPFIRFALELHDRTGCDLVDFAHASVCSREGLEASLRWAQRRR